MSETTMTTTTTNPDTSRRAMDALRKCELFASLPESALRDLAGRATLRELRRGEHVWNVGTPSSCVGVIASGGVKRANCGRDARQWISYVMRPGDVCGLAACVDGGACACDAVAFERSRVFLFPATAVRAAMDVNPGFARRVAEALARDVRRLLTACGDVTLRTPLQRVAGFVKEQAAGAAMFEMRETQTQIAARLGTVREVVGRALRRLEADGVVTRTGRVVRILNAEKLSSAATNGTK
jgi:CRP/FNR family cyclic AMP-dependent transcriptional regulator